LTEICVQMELDAKEATLRESEAAIERELNQTEVRLLLFVEMSVCTDARSCRSDRE
jgi:hypothetical protein